MEKKQGMWASWPMLKLLFWYPVILVKSLQHIWKSGTHKFCLWVIDRQVIVLTSYGSGDEAVAVLLPGFAINW